MKLVQFSLSDVNSVEDHVAVVNATRDEHENFRNTAFKFADFGAFWQL